MIASFAGAGYGNVIACALGGILCDLDHPRSSIGRVLFFLSIPINKRFGHRGITHAFIVYIPLVILGAFISKILMWTAIGALSHILIDCWNTSGVRAFVPFTQKTVVLFARDDWRIRTGSVPEIFVFLALVSLLTLSNYTSQIGGARKLLNTLMQSPKIATEEFMRAELKLCYIKGKWRWNDGVTEPVEWLVIGTEKSGSVLCFWDGKRIIRNDRGEFMRARLIETDKEWWIVRVKGIAVTQKPSFWIAEKEGKWHYSDKGQPAGGTIKAADGSFPQVVIAKSEDNLFMNWKEDSENE